MPSISGASWTVRPSAGRVDQDLAPLADQVVAAGRGDGVLELGTLAQPLEGELGRDLVAQAGGVGPVLVREGEEAGPVELGRFEELEQPVVVAVGLPGIAEDERGAESGLGRGGPDVGDAAQEALAVAPASHAGQEGARDMLEREVEVGHAGAEHGLDELVGQARRIEIEQPGALDPAATRPG